MEIERRNIQTDVRTVLKNRKIIGMIPYDSESLDLGGFTEVLSPGCFARSLKENDRIMSLWSHDEKQPLGSTASGTLSLRDSAEGLHFTISPPNNSWGNGALESVRRGDVDGCSFGFRVPNKDGESWEQREDLDLRTILDADLIEVSPTTFPAYPETSADTRGIKMNFEKTNIKDMAPEEQQRLFDKWLDESEGGPIKPEVETDLETRNANSNTEYKFDPAGASERDIFNRWIQKGQKGVSHDEYRALAKDSDPDGGFLIKPVQVSDRIREDLADVVLIRDKAQILLLDGAGTIRLPQVNNEMGDLTWTAEILTGSEDTELDFLAVELTPRPIARFIKVSNDLLMITTAPERIVRRQFQRKLGYVLERGYMLGTGAGEPLGIFTASDQGISTGRDVTAAKTNIIGYDDIANVVESVKEQYRKNCIWIGSRNFQNAVMKIKSGEGDPIFHRDPTGKMPNTIMGFPLHVSEFCPSQSSFAASTYAAILCDLSVGYTIVDMSQISIKRLDELFALTNQTGFVMRFWSDGKPVDENAFARLVMAAA